MTRRDLSDLPHYVYRYYDADDQPLYIGCTYHLEQREREHSRRFWFSRVARREFAEYPSRAEGLAAEKKAIEAEKPEINVLNVIEVFGDGYRTPRTTARLLAAAMDRAARRHGIDIGQES